MKSRAAMLVILAATVFGSRLLIAQLPPPPGKLVVRSVPTGATVTVEGMSSTQRTDVTFVVSPGNYAVSAGSPDAKPFCAKVSTHVTAGQTVTLLCNESGWTVSKNPPDPR